MRLFRKPKFYPFIRKKRKLIRRADELARILTLTRTTDMEHDRDWWGVRAWVLANDRDQQCGDLTLLDGLAMRNN
jgi:hypothetical protein